MSADVTLTAQSIVDSFAEVHECVYGWRPTIAYKGNQWYQVEQQVVHRSALLMEIGRLRGLAAQPFTPITDLEPRETGVYTPADPTPIQPPPATRVTPKPAKSLIGKLIDRLKGL